jgi:hypothetical protein
MMCFKGVFPLPIPIAAFFGACMVLLITISADAQSIVINELMTSNAGAVQDEDGDTSDWIELYNNSGNPVNLQRWTITDDSLETDKWEFPAATLQPGEYLSCITARGNWWMNI